MSRWKNGTFNLNNGDQMFNELVEPKKPGEELFIKIKTN